MPPYTMMVAASPSLPKRKGSSRHSTIGQEKDKDGKIISENASIDSLTNDLNLFTKDVGRYHLIYHPLKCNYAHIVTAERFKDDKLEIFDPQSGKILLWEKLAHSIELNKGIRVYRVDNLFVNTNYINGIVLKD